MGIDSDRFTIQAAKDGSEQAWRKLFDWHFDAVYRFCGALTGGRHNLAEELTQQVYITAAKQITLFDPNRVAFRAWLFGIAKNRHMTMRAGDRRRKRHEESSASRHPVVDNTKDPDLRVHEVLARLPSHYRAVLDAKYLRGLSVNQIAANRRATVEAVESLLRRARACFASEYEEIRTLA